MKLGDRVTASTSRRCFFLLFFYKPGAAARLRVTTPAKNRTPAAASLFLAVGFRAFLAQGVRIHGVTLRSVPRAMLASGAGTDFDVSGGRVQGLHRHGSLLIIENVAVSSMVARLTACRAGLAPQLWRGCAKAGSTPAHVRLHHRWSGAASIPASTELPQRRIISVVSREDVRGRSESTSPKYPGGPARRAGEAPALGRQKYRMRPRQPTVGYEGARVEPGGGRPVSPAVWSFNGGKILQS
jgi:hypothetical protein